MLQPFSHARYLEAGRSEGLPVAWLENVAPLLRQEQPRPLQSPSDLIDAYQEARSQAPRFEIRVQQLARRCAVPHQVRPGGLKSLERIVEKMVDTRLVPLDLLAGLLCFPSLSSLYAAVAQVCTHFEVLSGRDRFAFPERIGYRDIQLFVLLEHGLVAEVKLMHQDYLTLDPFEHRLYEIRRTLDGKEAQQKKQGLSKIERMVLDGLRKTSRQWYDQLWTGLSGEGLK